MIKIVFDKAQLKLHLADSENGHFRFMHAISHLPDDQKKKSVCELRFCLTVRQTINSSYEYECRACLSVSI